MTDLLKPAAPPRPAAADQPARAAAPSRAAEELPPSAELFAVVTEQSLMGIVLLQDFHVIYTNQKYLEMSEYSLDEVMRWTHEDLLKLVHPEDAPFVLEQLAKKQAGAREGIVSDYCYRGITKSGKVRWLEQHSRSVVFQGRTADLVTMIDITEQRAVEEELRRAKAELEQRVAERTAELQQTNEALSQEIGLRQAQEAILRRERQQLCAIFDAIDHPIYVAEFTSHEILFINKKIAASWGAVIGEPCHQVFQRSPTPCRHCVDPQRPEAQIGAAFIWDLQNAVDNRWYHCIEKVIRWTDGRPARLVIAIDIDKRKRAEEELQRACEELRELDRMKDSFLASLSHELRTPMVSAKGYTELLLEHQDLSPGNREWVQRIFNSLGRLEAIIDKLLDLARLQAGTLAPLLQPLDLVEAIDQSLQTLMPQLHSKKIRVVRSIAPSLPRVRADKQQLQSILLNLIDNAVKFSEPGGCLTLSARTAADFVEIAIADEGIGIPRADLDRIFDRFFQVDASPTRLYPGAGIGLALVKDLVRMHGGEVRVESEEGEGATFFVSLPVLS